MMNEQDKEAIQNVVNYVYEDELRDFLENMEEFSIHEQYEEEPNAVYAEVDTVLRTGSAQESLDVINKYFGDCRHIYADVIRLCVVMLNLPDREEDNEEEEQTRRDEKNGLYPDKEDIAN